MQGERHADSLEGKQERRQKDHWTGNQMSGRVFELAPNVWKSLELAPGSQMSGRVIEIENLQSHRKEKLHLSHVSLFTGTWHQSLWHLVV